MSPDAPTVHAGAVDIAGHGVLIEGASGAGKTSLAFGLVEAARARGLAAAFVSDDRTILEVRQGALHARPPAVIAGLAELRGHGVIEVGHLPETRIRLVVRLVEDALLERMPEPATDEISGVRIPLAMAPARHEAAAVRIALAALVRIGLAACRPA